MLDEYCSSGVAPKCANLGCSAISSRSEYLRRRSFQDRHWLSAARYTVQRHADRAALVIVKPRLQARVEVNAGTLNDLDGLHDFNPPAGRLLAAYLELPRN